MTNLRSCSFYELLPPNLKNLEGECISAALDAQTRDLVLYAVQRLQIYGNILEIDDIMADHLALTFDIRGYKTTLPLNKKRLLVQSALLNYSRMGTKTAVENAATIIHSETKITEWYEYKANPYFFRAKTDTSGIPIDQTKLNLLIETILDYKNVRSWLDEVRIMSTSNAYANTGNFVSTVGHIVANPKPIKYVLTKMGLQFVAIPIIHMKYQLDIKEEEQHARRDIAK